ncbi:MAG: hypothetical protein H8M99_09620 [Gloeobacteraceae cyanobacterium ES-bin-144]|nr:hypothetical protein [Verrucomicrobiales bacterium]
MKIPFSRQFTILLFSMGFISCVENTHDKPVGPVSDTSAIPWNSPVSGQGQGQLGMMPQNQYRR